MIVAWIVQDKNSQEKKEHPFLKLEQLKTIVTWVECGLGMKMNS